MTNIVERLRHSAPIVPVCGKAADEIERLRALKTPATSALLNITKGCLDSANAEIERLEARLARHVEIAAEQEGEIERLTGLSDWQHEEIERLRKLTDRPRDDGTVVVAVGGEPGASAGKSE